MQWQAYWYYLCFLYVVLESMESTLCWTCIKTCYPTSFVEKEFLTGQLTLEVRGIVEVCVHLICNVV